MCKLIDDGRGEGGEGKGTGEVPAERNHCPFWAGPLKVSKLRRKLLCLFVFFFLFSPLEVRFPSRTLAGPELTV